MVIVGLNSLGHLRSDFRNTGYFSGAVVRLYSEMTNHRGEP